MKAEEAKRLFSPELNLSPEARSLIAYVGTIGEDEVPYGRLMRMLQIHDEKKLRRVIAAAEDSGWLSVDRNTGRGHSPLFTYSPPKNGTLSTDSLPKNGTLNTDRVPEKGTLSQPAQKQDLEGSLDLVVLTTTPPVGPPHIAANGKPATRRGSKFCPADWVPSEKLLEQARQAGLDVEHELALFRDHEFNKPYTQWDRVFRNWIRRAEKALKARAKKPNGIHLTPAELDARGVVAVKQKTRMQVEHEARMAKA